MYLYSAIAAIALSCYGHSPGVDSLEFEVLDFDIVPLAGILVNTIKSEI
jgi:hypothetical protein